MFSLTQSKIVFLFGSGISIPAEMPSTKCITEQVISGKGIMRSTDENYYFGQPLFAHIGKPDEYVPRVLIFLNRLKIEIDLYYLYRIGWFTNYEDLYYVASQIYDSKSWEYDNPVVQPFIDKILKENEIRLDGRLIDLVREVTHYIQDVVWHSLNKKPSRIDHLNSLKDVCLDNQLSSVDIFTLNHDTVLEQYLSQNDIQVTDGFGKPINDVRYWEPNLFESKSSKVRLFKLHGSVNWFRFRPDSGDGRNESIGINLGNDLWHTKDSGGKMQYPVDGRPMFLIGTFNKMFQYTSSVYVYLHCHFHRSLLDACRLVICGYGFGDKGINTRIIEWIHSSDDHRVFVIHPKPEELKNAARGAISKNWDYWISKRKLTIIQKAIEETCWHDIRDDLTKDV